MRTAIRTTSIAVAMIISSTMASAQTNGILYLDGVNDYLSIQRPVSNSFTLEIWMNLQEPASNSAIPYLCGPIYDNHSNTDTEDFGLYCAGQTPGLAVGNSWAVTSLVAVSLNGWAHIAVVRDVPNTDALIYINGNLISSTISTDSKTLDGRSGLWIGKNVRDGDIWLHAYIDECRFWNKPLTQESIQSNMWRVLTGSEDGLVTYLNFDNQDFTDKTSYGNDATASGSPTFFMTWGFDVEPTVTSACIDAVMGIEFPTAMAQWYALQSTVDILSTNSWSDTGLRVLGNGNNRCFFDPAGFSPLKFYRIAETTN